MCVCQCVYVCGVGGGGIHSTPGEKGREQAQKNKRNAIGELLLSVCLFLLKKKYPPAKKVKKTNKKPHETKVHVWCFSPVYLSRTKQGLKNSTKGCFEASIDLLHHHLGEVTSIKCDYNLGRTKNIHS